MLFARASTSGGVSASRDPRIAPRTPPIAATAVFGANDPPRETIVDALRQMMQEKYADDSVERFPLERIAIHIGQQE